MSRLYPELFFSGQLWISCSCTSPTIVVATKIQMFQRKLNQLPRNMHGLFFSSIPFSPRKITFTIPVHLPESLLRCTLPAAFRQNFSSVESRCKRIICIFSFIWVNFFFLHSVHCSVLSSFPSLQPSYVLCTFCVLQFANVSLQSLQQLLWPEGHGPLKMLSSPHTWESTDVCIQPLNCIGMLGNEFKTDKTD